MKADLSLEKVNLTSEQVLGDLVFLGVEKSPLYKDNTKVEGEHAGVVFTLASSLQGKAVAFQFNFYEFGTDTLAITEAEKKHLLDMADTLKFQEAVIVDGFSMRQASETVIKNRENTETKKWEKRQETKQVFDISAKTIRRKKDVGADPTTNTKFTK